LIASATRIYGEQMDALWGEILPAPAEQVTAVYDGDKIEVCGLTFTALDTPGHAYHHHTWRLEDIAFTGDAAGINLPTIDFVDLPAPPPEFHLETWQATIQRLSKEPLEAIYPTHFGRLEAWQSQLTRLSALMEEAVEVVRRELDGGADRETLLATYQAWYRARAEERQVPEAVFDRYVTANPPYMSVDGIARYWRKKEKQAASKG
jgi:glyoxylase-like metal-dependent hydrolase (beta-lactamase superfamily II)